MDSQPAKSDNSHHNPETWVDQYGGLLYRHALRRVKDFTAAEDVVQDTFLAALQAFKNFNGDSTMRTWLIAILKNKSVDHIRKRIKEQRSDKIEYLPNVAAKNFDRPPEWPFQYCVWQNTPLNLYAHKEFLDTLHKCLSKIPRRMAGVFMMREIDGLSTKEICEALKITPANCWVLLHRSKQRLRACIECYLVDFKE
jgi:RNA polymerase sigma-70 factor (ECF subfamily)